MVVHLPAPSACGHRWRPYPVIAGVLWHHFIMWYSWPRDVLCGFVRADGIYCAIRLLIKYSPGAGGSSNNSEVESDHF